MLGCCGLISPPPNAEQCVLSIPSLYDPLPIAAFGKGVLAMSLSCREIASAVLCKNVGDAHNSKWPTRYRSIEILLGLVLLVAAGLKAHQLFSRSVMPLFGLIHAELLLVGVIQAELLLSIWLLVGGFIRLRFTITLICFSLFATLASFESLHALPSCGCFGNLKVPPAIMAFVDVCAVVALWSFRPRRIGIVVDFHSHYALFAGALFAAGASAALWTSYLLAKPFMDISSLPTGGGSSLVILQPRLWLNKPFALFDEIDGSDPLRRGRWLVMFYHYDCESCLKAIRHYRLSAFDATEDGPRLAFIAVPPAAPLGEDPVPTASTYLHLSLRPDHDWLATTPIVVALENGRVLSAIDGNAAAEIPHITW